MSDRYRVTTSYASAPYEPGTPPFPPGTLVEVPGGEIGEVSHCVPTRDHNIPCGWLVHVAGVIAGAVYPADVVKRA